MLMPIWLKAAVKPNGTKYYEDVLVYVNDMTSYVCLTTLML